MIILIFNKELYLPSEKANNTYYKPCPYAHLYHEYRYGILWSR